MGKQKAAPEAAVIGHPMFQMNRWVERKGTQVRFGNVIGAFVGREYVYTFPTIALARKFEALVSSKDSSGSPVGVDPKIWGKYDRTKG